MAEIVEYRREQSLPEYEQMKRINLFNDSEIREIMKKRDNFNGKIVRKEKSMRDYLEFIKFERQLVTLIEKRRKVRNIDEMKGSIERPITLRIKNLYSQVTERFPENLRTWDEYLKFVRAFNFANVASTILDRMLQLHGDKPEMWLRAVIWEYEQNPDRAKHYMLRGLQRHPTNSMMYCQFVKIKLLEANKVDEQSGKRQHILEQAKVIYENSRKKIHTIEHHVDMLEIVTESPYARNLMKNVLQDMQNDFPLEELTWHTLAQRELVGMHMDMENSPEDDPSAMKKRLCNSIEVYKQATEIIKTEKMWTFYIDALLEIQNDPAHGAMKYQALHVALKSACDAGCLSEHHFIMYIEELIKSNSQVDCILGVFEKATKSHEKSTRLWEMWMRYHIQKESEQGLYEIFRQGVRKLADDSNPLWQLIIRYYQMRPDLPNRVEEIFNEAILQPASVSSRLKAQYIEYVALTKSLQAAREKYDNLVQNSTPCLEIHEKMAQLESMQVGPNVERWRKCHENATHFFGKSNINVWLEYIKFERTQDTPKNISLIYDRATKTLNVDLVDRFESEHNLLNVT